MSDEFYQFPNGHKRTSKTVPLQHNRMRERHDEYLMILRDQFPQPNVTESMVPNNCEICGSVIAA